MLLSIAEVWLLCFNSCLLLLWMCLQSSMLLTIQMLTSSRMSARASSFQSSISSMMQPSVSSSRVPPERPTFQPSTEPYLIPLLSCFIAPSQTEGFKLVIKRELGVSAWQKGALKSKRSQIFVAFEWNSAARVGWQVYHGLWTMTRNAYTTPWSVVIQIVAVRKEVLFSFHNVTVTRFTMNVLWLVP